MKLSDIQEEWAIDAKIDETNLGNEASRTPILHAKYITYLGDMKLRLRKSDSEYYNLRREKYRYYRGEMSYEELADRGWNQYQGTKPLKNEMEEIIASDKDLLQAGDRIEYYRTVVYTLEQIIRSINSRTWDIKSGIEWTKFTNGMI